ncbi:hypothetical protein [Bartonella sp. F02]|uniref:hypothetical protein n=1 Tax=Bartonella sp. F02 TaxID=2967262 RepID=UPI0022A93C23|nr:hypothetical protein [Bartonella sp. F02]MCZ2328165.1 hypothetical protein [Bartonella sp. F02]
MIKTAIFVCRIFLSVPLLFITGCVHDANVSPFEQKILLKEDVMPRFSIKPKAATEHFTEIQRQILIDQLTHDANRIRATLKEESTNSLSLMKIKEDAYRETKSILRKIEMNNNQ